MTQDTRVMLKMSLFCFQTSGIQLGLEQQYTSNVSGIHQPTEVLRKSLESTTFHNGNTKKKGGERVIPKV